MAASPDQLRQFVSENAQDSTYYTASFSPHLQGVELVQFYQLTSYTGAKIRSNTSPVSALSGSSQGWQLVGDSYTSFNDELSPENYGALAEKSVNAYSVGRNVALGPTGQSTYITYVTSGSQGFVPGGSRRSAASLFVKNRLDTYISHYIEQRDLGQTHDYADGTAFEECDAVDRNPALILQKIPESLVLPTELVQAGMSLSSFDGVVEALDIRKVSDRSSIDMPFVIKGPKGSLSVSDDNMKSYQFSDVFNLRLSADGATVAPFLDYVSVFGSGQALIDQPGAFSDAIENDSAFQDTSKVEHAYETNALDAQMKNLMLSGTVSGSTQVTAPDTAIFPTYLVAARHGFVYSQNDNFGYDSIAFGGLKK